METIISTSEKQTLKVASKWAKTWSKQLSKAPGALCICLYGDLGAGKTTFSKGFAQGLGIPAKQIKSPTYTLIRSYKIGKNQLYHCDFYRITAPDDVISADLQEIFHQKNAIVLIEWPERIEAPLPKNSNQRINLYFEYKNPTTRIINY